jgi:hypothetical protein
MANPKVKKVSQVEEAEAHAHSNILRCCSLAAGFYACILVYALVAYLKGWPYKPEPQGFRDSAVLVGVFVCPILTFLLSLSSIKTQLASKMFMVAILWFMLGLGFLTYLRPITFVAAAYALMVGGLLFLGYKDLVKIKDPLGIR